MSYLTEISQSLADFVPLLFTIAIIAVILWLANWIAWHRAKKKAEPRLRGQVVMLVLSAVSLVAIILTLPVSESTRHDLLSLLGLLLTGVIALSSTTFVSNAMAGLMLRAVHSFHYGDFIRAGAHFGRVTERGLFHTEIQSEDRDLITLPNLFLASNPVTVIRSSGTMVSCEISLGYDVPHDQLEQLLKEAAVGAGLQEPFFQILTLGDFAITYRISGYYAEVKHLLSVRSRLRREVLDTLHGADIEIVSPTFMNQRQFSQGEKFISVPKRREPQEEDNGSSESMIFDKAEKMEKVRVLAEEREALVDKIKALKEQMDSVSESQMPELKSEMFQCEERMEKLDNIIRIAKEKTNE